MRRSPLSGQASLLRTSLLLSLGLSPLACGGSTVLHGSNGGDGGSDRESTAGTRDPGTAGSGHDGGYSNGGHSNTGGTRNTAGSSGYAGTDHGGGNSSVAGGPSHGGSSGAGGGGTSGAGAGGTGGRGGASGGGPIDPSECPNPVYNPGTKLTDCSNGRKHRPTAIACTYNGGGGGPGDGSGGTPSTCTADTQCTALPHGFCSRDGNQVPVCKAGCVTDSDCGATGVCACDGIHPGHCVTAGCVTDADCGPNSLCAPADGVCGGSSFQCTSPQDLCINNAQCVGTCAMQNDHRACNNAVCGRPFLIAERARLAAVEMRTDWLDAKLTPDPSGLTPLERAQLAAHWARLGQMEHASIAAFARFNLQLLSLGAPSNLVEACNRALADETAHTRTCFALASAYGGLAVGPARLDIEHCFEETSLIAIAKLVLREGCLGETVAALEAVAAAEVATDSAVKQALERIARDELNHAELAFQFVRWALSSSSLEERHELACEAAQQLADFESEARNGERTRTNDRLAAHGLLGSDALRAIHLAAARDVSRPLLAALFHVEESNEA